MWLRISTCVWGPGTPLFGLWRVIHRLYPQRPHQMSILSFEHIVPWQTTSFKDLCIIHFTQYCSAHPGSTRLWSEILNSTDSANQIVKYNVIDVLHRMQTFVGCLSSTWLSEWTGYYQSDSQRAMGAPFTMRWVLSFCRSGINLIFDMDSWGAVDGGRLVVFEMFEIMGRFGVSTLCFEVRRFYFSSRRCWEVFL